MVVNLTNEEFFGVTLTIFDTNGDDVRGNDVGAGHGGSEKFLTNAGGATWWPNF